MKLIPTLTKQLENCMSCSKFLIKLNSLYYKNIVKKEVDLGKITCGDHVLCIGGGPLPSTAIEIAMQTGAAVYIIDNDPKAVKRAQEVITALKLSNIVKVKVAAGENIDVEGFSVVHVALQAYPQDEILWNLWKKADVGTRILMRRPRKGLEKMYSQLKSRLFNNMPLEVPQNNLTMKATLLFVKGSGRNNNEKATASSIGNNIHRDAYMVS